MLQILGDDKIAEDINYLNSKQKKEFSEVHRWAKDCIKRNWHNVEPTNIFFPGSGGTSKTHLVKVVYHTISKTWLYHC